jgi:tetratricopeptide (TPR) repeat protein
VSHALIVICSPSSAKSHYVNEEIRLFKSRHPERPVIPLIVAGKPVDPELECFPPVLKFKLDAKGRVTKKPVELLAADAREEGDGKGLALAKVVAGLLGVSSDDIFRPAMRERRRRQQRWIAGLSVLALMLAGLAVWAEINRREAVEQRAEAERNFALARQGANALIFDIAQALRDQEGMRRRRWGRSSALPSRSSRSSSQNPTATLSCYVFRPPCWTSSCKPTPSKVTRPSKRRRREKRSPSSTAWPRPTPGNASRQHDLFVSYVRVGEVLVAQGNLAEALKSYRDGLAIADSLAKADPGNAVWQRDISVSYNNVGDVLKEQGKLAEALKSYQDGLAIGDRFGQGRSQRCPMAARSLRLL